MNSKHLTWLARTVIGCVVLSTLWLADATHRAEQQSGPAKPRLIAASPTSPTIQPR